MADETWEAEKDRRIKKLHQSQQYVNQLGGWLTQCGVGAPSIIHGKLDAIIDMLMEAGVVTERQVLKMEEKFAEDVIKDLEDMAQQVRVAAISQGAKLPPMPVNSMGLVTPGG